MLRFKIDNFKNYIDTISELEKCSREHISSDEQYKVEIIIGKSHTEYRIFNTPEEAISWIDNIKEICDIAYELGKEVGFQKGFSFS